MRKIFSLLTITLFASFISCDEYEPGVDAPASLGFEKASDQVGFVAESNVETVKVYATTKSNVDRVVTISQLLEGVDEDGQPNSTAVEGDYTVSSTSVTIPAGEWYGSFDIVFNPELDVTVSRYVTFQINNPGEEYVINSTKNKTKVTYSRLCFSNTIVHNIVLDQYGSEITWNITDSSGAVVASGGPYSDSATNVAQPQAPTTYTLPDGNYTYTINDSYGDGMFNGANIGTYKLSKDCGSVLIDFLGNGFTVTRSHTFSLP